MIFDAECASCNLADRGIENVYESTQIVRKQRRFRKFRAPHPVTLVKSLQTRWGCLVVMAGGSHISCCLFHSFFRSSGTCSTSSLFEQYGEGTVGCVPTLETTILDRGEVTCADFATLPSSEYALGVIGTTEGTVAVVVFHGGSLFKTMELPLATLSKGTISVSQSVQDIEIGFDPAGRPEFVAAATLKTTVVADISYFVNLEELSLGFQNPERLNKVTAVTAPSSTPFPASCSTSSQSPRDAFILSFTQSTIVRLLVPHRHNASFPVDVALLIVLSCGTVRFVKRSTLGGSVSSLLDCLRRYQHSSSATGYLCDSGREKQESPASSDWEKSTSCFPRAVYIYSLAPLELMTTPSTNLSSSCAPIVINDACLVFNSSTSCMDLILVGAVPAQQPNFCFSSSVRQFPGVVTSGEDNYHPENAAEIMSKTYNSLSKVRSPFLRSPPPPLLLRDVSPCCPPCTLGGVSLGCTPYPSFHSFSPSSPTFAAGIASASYPLANVGSTKAWWGILERAVLPHGTLHRLSHRICEQYNGGNHNCTFLGCITPFSAHTTSWTDKVMLKGERIAGYEVGLSGVCVTGFSSSPGVEKRAILCAAGDLLWGSLESENSSKDQRNIPVGMSATRDGSVSLPALEAFGSTGGPVIESMTFATLSSSFDPVLRLALGPNRIFLLTASGSTITLWPL